MRRRRSPVAPDHLPTPGIEANQRATSIPDSFAQDAKRLRKEHGDEDRCGLRVELSDPWNGSLGLEPSWRIRRCAQCVPPSETQRRAVSTRCGDAEKGVVPHSWVIPRELSQTTAASSRPRTVRSSPGPPTRRSSRSPRGWLVRDARACRSKGAAQVETPGRAGPRGHGCDHSPSDDPMQTVSPRPHRSRARPLAPRLVSAE